MSSAALDSRMEEARESHRNWLRELRRPMLELLDMAYFLALNNRADAATLVAIVEHKQYLRNITQHPAIEA